MWDPRTRTQRTHPPPKFSPKIPIPRPSPLCSPPVLHPPPWRARRFLRRPTAATARWRFLHHRLLGLSSTAATGVQDPRRGRSKREEPVPAASAAAAIMVPDVGGKDAVERVPGPQVVAANHGREDDEQGEDADPGLDRVQEEERDDSGNRNLEQFDAEDDEEEDADKELVEASIGELEPEEADDDTDLEPEEADEEEEEDEGA
ncbi:hypothetical protein ACP70R_018473 [Stipagrostis hirtigluma subsp. patula]